MKFRVSQMTIDGYYEVFSPQRLELVIRFEDTEIGLAMAHDYCDFLNDKYYDKEINKEWPEIHRHDRINYHLGELSKLCNEKNLFWNEHGTGVEVGE